MENLKPGRELDAFVAERVMGETPGYVWCASGYYVTDDHYLNLPHYSTDIAAAWEVVENMRAKDPNFIIRFDHSRWEAGRAWYSQYDGWVAITSVAETAPMAICKAALKAVGAI